MEYWQQIEFIVELSLAIWFQLSSRTMDISIIQVMPVKNDCLRHLLFHRPVILLVQVILEHIDWSGQYLTIIHNEAHCIYIRLGMYCFEKPSTSACICVVFLSKMLEFHPCANDITGVAYQGIYDVFYWILCYWAINNKHPRTHCFVFQIKLIPALFHWVALLWEKEKPRSWLYSVSTGRWP